jgi:hypothetical protein
LADNWFENHLFPVQRIVEQQRRPGQAKVKVAILDTGVCERDEGIQEAMKSGAIRIENCKGFPDTNENTDNFHPLRDGVGYGTHGACILLKTAPYAELYIARISNDEEVIPSTNNYEATVKASALLDSKC